MTRIPLKRVTFIGHRETGNSVISFIPEIQVVEQVIIGGVTWWYPMREVMQMEPAAPIALPLRSPAAVVSSRRPS